MLGEGTAEKTENEIINKLRKDRMVENEALFKIFKSPLWLKSSGDNIIQFNKKASWNCANSFH